MKKNTVVIIPSIIPWNFTADFVRQTALELSRKRIKVFIYNINQKPFKLNDILHGKKLITSYNKYINFVKTFHLFPLERYSEIYKFNAGLFFILFLIYIRLFFRSYKLILWLQHPQFFWINQLVKKFNIRCKVLYDYLDYFIKDPNFTDPVLDQLLIKNADLVAVNSKTLLEHCKKYRKNICLVAQGFDLNTFKNYKTKFINHNHKAKPVIGFVGGINRRLDFNLIYNLVKRNPDWQFNFYGPVQDILGGNLNFINQEIDKLKNNENFIQTDFVPKEKIPDIINSFNVAIIPYDISFDFNTFSYPMKLFEYFYMGKPVVSTPVEELKRFPEFVKIGVNVYEWEKHIKKLLSNPWPNHYQQQQRKLAIDNSWENKIKRISKLIT